jgi:Tfp pilus assembly protein PilF
MWARTAVVALTCAAAAVIGCSTARSQEAAPPPPETGGPAQRTDVDRLWELAQREFGNGDYASAVTTLESLLGKDPSHEYARALLTEARWYRESETTRRQVSRGSEAGARAYRGGSYKTAVTNWTRVLEIDPENAAAVVSLAKAKARLLCEEPSQPLVNLPKSRGDRRLPRQ